MKDLVQIKIGEEMQDKELIVPNKPALQLLTGGKPPLGSDWLSNLPKETCFLSQNKGMKNGVLDMWVVWNKTSKHVLLKTELNQTIYAWVIPKEFCLMNDCVEILERGPEEDGPSN